jgi:hypothetical protein
VSSAAVWLCASERPAEAVTRPASGLRFACVRSGGCRADRAQSPVPRSPTEGESSAQFPRTSRRLRPVGVLRPQSRAPPQLLGCPPKGAGRPVTTERPALDASEPQMPGPAHGLGGAGAAGQRGPWLNGAGTSVGALGCLGGSQQGPPISLRQRGAGRRTGADFHHPPRAGHQAPQAQPAGHSALPRHLVLQDRPCANSVAASAGQRGQRQARDGAPRRGLGEHLHGSGMPYQGPPRSGAGTKGEARDGVPCGHGAAQAPDEGARR